MIMECSGAVSSGIADTGGGVFGEYGERMRLSDMDADQRAALLAEQEREHQALCARGLSLNLTRGKPSSEQLDLSNALLDLPGHADVPAGPDVRNYGGLDGLREIREIFGELFMIDPDLLMASDNASLSLMHDCVTYASLHGIAGQQPWAGQQVKFVCPVPGYDRHFAITEHLGIEMIPIPLTDDGVDVDELAALLADEQVKGMWVVPMYGNPSGTVWSREVVEKILALPAAPDFRIFWDNAYGLHHLTDEPAEMLPILDMAAAAGNPDRVFAFASTSKITFAGAGVSFFGSSKANLDWYRGHMQFRTIGPDKINHWRHAAFFGDAEGVRAHMRKHREQLAPKFALVDEVLSERLGEYGVAEWTKPRGGYFVTLRVPSGTASRVVALAKEAGIALTPAGASHPLRHDPDDAVIRLAPSFPPVDELRPAMEGVATCVLLAAAERS